MTTAAPTIAPGSARAWILAARFKTLPAAAVPVVVGTACAQAAGGAALLPALAALLGALLIQIGTNFANDVFDYEQGADTDARLGPPRAVQSGLLTPREMRAGMVVAFALATVAGVYLLAIGGWPIAVIGVASIVCGIAYTGGPYPLGYNGLGDLFVFVFFGPVAVAGTAYVQLGSVPALAWWASIPVGALATAILVVNNLRDVDTDVRCGKRTLAVRFGRSAARAEYVALLALSYAVPVVLAATGRASSWTLLSLASLPLAAGLARTMLSTVDAAALNRCLARTALLLIAFGLPLSLGLALAP